MFIIVKCYVLIYLQEDKKEGNSLLFSSFHHEIRSENILNFGYNKQRTVIHHLLWLGNPCCGILQQ